MVTGRMKFVVERTTKAEERTLYGIVDGTGANQRVERS